MRILLKTLFIILFLSHSEVFSKSSEEYIELEHQVLAPNYNPLPVVLHRGKGVWLWDVEGKKYLDMMSAYSAVSHGHANERILRALRQQANRLNVTSRAYCNDQLSPMMEKLCQLSGMDRGLPMNTGAEAVETAIKAARRWGHHVKGIPENKAEIIVAKNNFHGRTTTIISFSSSKKNRDGFGPFTPGFVSVPFGNIHALRAAITPNTAAVILEPIQGEAGIQLPPKGYLKKVQKLCRKNNVLFILDEVQSGLGRTGKMFAFQHYCQKPDGLILGKALGGGVLPVSAFLGTEELMTVFTPGSHGSTFGGNALAAAVAHEALKVLEEEFLPERSAKLGGYLLKELQKIDSPVIKGVHGIGLWIGIDVNTDIISARELIERLMDRGLLTKETHDKTIRIAPPLTITHDELDYGIQIIKDVLEEIELQVML